LERYTPSPQRWQEFSVTTGAGLRNKARRRDLGVAACYP
jgi:hypothetical protein